MNDDWELGFAGDLHLAQENLLLYVSRRVVVVIVKADLTESDHARMARKRFEFNMIVVGGQFGVVRMNADSGVDPVVPLGDTNRAIESARPGAAADSENVYYARGASALQHFSTIGVESRTLQMRVGIYQHLLEAGADGDIFEKAREHRQAFLADGG